MFLIDRDLLIDCGEGYCVNSLEQAHCSNQKLAHN
jgi:hypothetical protein